MKKQIQIVESDSPRADRLLAEIRDGHVRDAEAVKSGKLRQEDLYFASPETIRGMTVHLSLDMLEKIEL